MKVKQNKIVKRLMLCLPIFAISIALMFIDFSIIWRYFAWVNQSLSVFTFWALTVWLARKQKCYWLTLVPAIFMTVVCTTYILIAPEGFQLSIETALPITLVAVILTAGSFFRWKIEKSRQTKA